MNDESGQSVRSDAKRVWQTPELREQTIHTSTAQGKTGSPTNEVSPVAGKPS